jgi:hypothetical protein
MLTEHKEGHAPSFITIIKAIQLSHFALELWCPPAQLSFDIKNQDCYHYEIDVLLNNQRLFGILNQHHYITSREHLSSKRGEDQAKGVLRPTHETIC